MSEGTRSQASLGWLARRYALLAVVVVVLVSVSGGLVAGSLARSSPYDAEALVIATELQLRPEQLPRLGESVFTSGSVARAVRDGLRLDEDFRTLVPDVIALDPVPESISFVVHGRSDDPDEAARLANAAATAFVAAMNRAGAAVGVFVVQDQAFVPRERALRGPGALLGTLVSLFAGVVLAVVAVTALHGARRPVLSAEQAAELTRAPVVGDVRLPWDGDVDGPVPGRRPLAHRLLREGVTEVVLEGTFDSYATRQQLAAALRAAPELDGRVRVVQADDAPDDDDLDGDASDDGRRVLLVAEMGDAPAALLSVRADVSDDDLVGLAFVRRDGRPLFARRHGQSPADTADAEPAPPPGEGSRPGSGSTA